MTGIQTGTGDQRFPMLQGAQTNSLCYKEHKLTVYATKMFTYLWASL